MNHTQIRKNLRSGNEDMSDPEGEEKAQRTNRWKYCDKNIEK